VAKVGGHSEKNRIIAAFAALSSGCLSPHTTRGRDTIANSERKRICKEKWGNRRFCQPEPSAKLDGHLISDVSDARDGVFVT